MFTSGKLPNKEKVVKLLMLKSFSKNGRLDLRYF